MYNALLIARREYLERVRSKAFRISTVVIPLVFAAIFGVGAFSALHVGTLSDLIIASNDVQLANTVRNELASGHHPPRHLEVVAPASEADRARLTRRVNDQHADAYLWLQMPPGALQPQVFYASRSATDLNSDTIRDAIHRAVLHNRLQQDGMAPHDLTSILKPLEIQRLQVHDNQAIPSNGSQHFWAAYGMMFLLYFSVTFYGLNVGRSVVEEKTSRIFEVLLSSVKAESLMLGKLLGVGAAALTQLAIWFTVAALYAGSQFAAQTGITGLHSLGIEPLQVVFFVVYFILGFLFYSSVSAGLGSAMSTEQEMNQFQGLIVMPLILSFTLFSYVLNSPNSSLAVALSLFPPCTPLIMCLRMGVEMPPAWQLILSILLMAVAIYIALWIASRVYRIGILMYGKRPTLPEMIRWMQYR